MTIPQIVYGSRELHVPSEFLAFLLALQMCAANDAPLASLSDRHWQDLLSFCNRAQLTLLLSRMDRSLLPLWVAEQIERNLADNTKRSERIKATYNEVASALTAAGVPHVVVKGFTQVPHYAPAIWSRSQSDIDLYCPPEYLQRAQAALESIGYSADTSNDYRHADHLPMMVRKGAWKWRGNHFDPEMPLSIELHFSLWNARLLLNPLPEIGHFWDRRQVRQLDEFSFHALGPVDHLAYFSLHILRNLIFGSWVVHHVFELAYFLHQHADNDEFWRKRAQTHSASLRSYQAVAFAYAKSWFNCNLSSEVELEISQLAPAIGHWLNFYVFSSLGGMFHETKDWALLNAVLVPSTAQGYTWLRRMLFPQRMPRRNSHAIYFKDRKPRATSTVLGEELAPARRLRYLIYVSGRIFTHLLVITRTLSKGLLWWLTIPELNHEATQKPMDTVPR
ncbi:MAG: nucleotidyltransferase family protein [Acidobacteria bacterium]|nr:nucleotidyltransferase family protein [Acidobacteriota bacterium]